MTLEMPSPSPLLNRPSLWPFCTAAMGLAAAAMAGLFVGAVAAWVDPEGRIVLSDGEDPPSRGAVRVEPGELGERWKGSFLEPVQRRDTDSSTAENRLNREVRALLDELERGDRGTARAGLLRLYREHPTRPDVALALAHSERRRGRLESAEQIVATLLTTPAAR